MPTEGGEIHSPQMMPERSPDSQLTPNSVPEQSPAKRGLLSSLKSLLNLMGRKVEKTAVKATEAGVDPRGINPFSKEPPQSPPTQPPSSEPSQS